MIPNVQFIEEEWIPALESGEYRQGSGYLRRQDNTFCCLGVACDLLVKKGLLPEWRLSDGIYAIDAKHGTNPASYSLLPDVAAEYIGTNWYGEFSAVFYQASTIDPPTRDLVGLNDGARMNFSEIADQLKEVVREHKEENTNAN